MWNPSRSRCSSRPARRRKAAAAREPGANEVLTHGGTRRPRSTARRATSPAATSSAGFDVFVQEVMEAITIAP